MTIQKMFREHLSGIIMPNKQAEAKHWVYLLALSLDALDPVRQARYYGIEYVQTEDDIYTALAYLARVAVSA